jgi:hypothetical protein
MVVPLPSDFDLGQRSTFTAFDQIKDITSTKSTLPFARFQQMQQFQAIRLIQKNKTGKSTGFEPSAL